MFLPTRATVEVEEHRIPGRGGRSSSTKVVYRLLQTYANYRFFGVRAEEKQPGTVRPPREPEAPSSGNIVLRRDDARALRNRSCDPAPPETRLGPSVPHHDENRRPRHDRPR